MPPRNDGKPAFIFDVDEVIVEWRPAFLQWMERQGFVVVQCNDDCWDFTGLLPGMASEVRDRYIEEFNRSADYANLQTRACATLVLRALRRWYCENIFAVVSATGCGFSTIAHRTRMLHDLGAGFDRVHYLEVKQPKAEVFGRYPVGSVVFEDSPAHAQSAFEAGHRVVLFDQPYNRRFGAGPSVRRVVGWGGAFGAVRALIGDPGK
jgi:hypothetical protein